MIETENYILFWKDRLSNFSRAFFVDENGIKFNCVEQYFMYKKAEYFGDTEAAKKILRTDKPWEAKKLGRTVRGYDDEAWSKVREEIMYKGNLLRYEQNPHDKRFLLNPNWKDKHFVEANPYDKIWAIGMSPEDDLAGDPRYWKGQNLLGKVLDKVREELLKRGN